MGKNRLFLYAGCFALFIFGIVFFLSWTDELLPSNVKVSYTPPVEVPADKNSLDRESGNSSAISPAAMPGAAPISSASGQEAEPSVVLSASQPLENLVLHIQDAMGEPIASGVLSAGTKEYKFTKGLLTITDPWAAEIPVNVSAAGYAPVEKVVNPDDVSSHTVVMEYVSSFEFNVSHTDGSAVAQHYSIRLWKGESPQRPLQAAASVLTTKSGANLNKTGFALQQGECRVIQGLFPCRPADQFFDFASDGYAMTGDLLLNVGNCAWAGNTMPQYDMHQRPGFSWNARNFIPIRKAQSSKLRIWDTLCLAQQKESNSTNLNNEKCEIQRNAKTGYYFLTFPELPADRPVFRELQTDSNGKCRIDDLPPALYYAQAYKDDQTSAVIPLHPACGGVTLGVENHSRVWVWVKREGLEQKNRKRSFIDGSEVFLQALKPQTGFYSAVTKDGNVDFQNVPYGNYHLIVNPYDGQRVEKDVLIQKPEERIDVSISGWEKYAITGIVIEAETGKPVSNYELILDELNTTEVVKTDEEGRFVFPDMQVGMYRINIDLSRMEDFPYLPRREFLLKKYDRFITLRTVAVPDDVPDNKTVVIKLDKALETRFSGKVITKDQKPAAGAAISISCEDPVYITKKSKLFTVPQKPVTDQNGNFSVKVVCGKETLVKQCSFEIAALYGSQKLPDSLLNKEQWEKEHWEAAGGYVEARNLGSLLLDGKPGQVFDNLQIVLSGKNDGVIHGKLLAEEENFVAVDVYVQQNAFKMRGKVDENGNFTIENLAPGDFELRVEPQWRIEVETPYDLKTPQKYLEERLKLRMPENQKEMYVDVTLRKNSYLMGWIGYAGGDPFRFASVEAEKENKEKVIYLNSVATNHKGFFFIDGLSSSEFYRLLFSERESGKMLYRSEPINSGIGEVTFQVKL